MKLQAQLIEFTEPIRRLDPPLRDYNLDLEHGGRGVIRAYTTDDGTLQLFEVRGGRKKLPKGGLDDAVRKYKATDPKAAALRENEIIRICEEKLLAALPYTVYHYIAAVHWLDAKRAFVFRIGGGSVSEVYADLSLPEIAAITPLFQPQAMADVLTHHIRTQQFLYSGGVELLNGVVEVRSFHVALPVKIETPDTVITYRDGHISTCLSNVDELGLTKLHQADVYSDNSDLRYRFSRSQTFEVQHTGGEYPISMQALTDGDEKEQGKALLLSEMLYQVGIDVMAANARA